MISFIGTFLIIGACFCVKNFNIFISLLLTGSILVLINNYYDYKLNMQKILKNVDKDSDKKGVINYGSGELHVISESNDNKSTGTTK